MLHDSCVSTQLDSMKYLKHTASDVWSWEQSTWCISGDTIARADVRWRF